MTLEEAVAYLKEEDLATMAVGTYEVDGDFYFMIQEYETKEAADWSPGNPQELYGYSVDHFRRGSH